MMKPLILMWLIYAPFANALGPADFYCKETPAGQPLYYETVVKGCDGKKDTTQQVCALTAMCIYVGSDLRQLAEKESGKKFPALTHQEVAAMLSKLGPTDWFMSSLTCEKTNKTEAICPSPEECKNGDFFYKARPANLASSKFLELKERFNQDQTNPGSIPKFPVQSESGAIKP